MQGWSGWRAGFNRNQRQASTWWESGAREMKGIGKGAVLNMDHGVKTGREENEGMLQTVKMR